MKRRRRRHKSIGGAPSAEEEIAASKISANFKGRKQMKKYKQKKYEQK